MEKYFGKYRGKVTNNIDPMRLGRVQISVPSILGDGRLSWAMPCVPYAGMQVGFFAIPPINANIWVEFEGGNIDYPIWTGCFWGKGEFPPVPNPAASPEIMFFKTKSITLTCSDVPGSGEATLEVLPPAVAAPLKMAFNSAGIQIECNPAKVSMTPKGIDAEIRPSAVSMNPSKISAANAASSVTVQGTGVEATNGPASVALTGPKVDINKGAVEVI